MSDTKECPHCHEEVSKILECHKCGLQYCVLCGNLVTEACPRCFGDSEESSDEDESNSDSNDDDDAGSDDD